MERSMVLYLILHYPAGHWDFVKGNVEKGENEKRTTLREIKEETGLEDITFIPNFRKVVEYYYRREGQVIRKRVSFYLAKSQKKDVKLSHEHQDYSWSSYTDSINKITYRNARSLLKLANARIENWLLDTM